MVMQASCREDSGVCCSIRRAGLPAGPSLDGRPGPWGKGRERLYLPAGGGEVKPHEAKVRVTCWNRGRMSMEGGKMTGISADTAPRQHEPPICTPTQPE